MSFLAALILFGAVIFVHELGHFLFAKALGVKVEKFALGFGPVLFGRKYGETEYLLCALPLGGYVKMLGENVMEGGDGPALKTEDDEEPVELTEADLKRAFGTQPLWKKFLIVFMGPMFNILFATVLLVALYLFKGMIVYLPEVGQVQDGTPAMRAGLVQGDLITAIDGAAVESWADMTAVIKESPGRELELTVQRNGSELYIRVTPEMHESTSIFGEKIQVGLIGIQQSGNSKTVILGPVKAVLTALHKTVEIALLIVMAVVKLIQRIIPADTIGGPILIFQLAGESAQRGAMDFMLFTAVISINLGILNLLPIPVLDGGHILFMGIEAMLGRPLKESTVMAAQRVGLALLVLLIVFAFYNDIMRIVTGAEFP